MLERQQSGACSGIGLTQSCRIDRRPLRGKAAKLVQDTCNGCTRVARMLTLSGQASEKRSGQSEQPALGNIEAQRHAGVEMQCACTQNKKACTKSSSQLIALVGCSKSPWPPPSNAHSSNCTHHSSRARLAVTRDCISAVFVGTTLPRTQGPNGLRPAWPKLKTRVLLARR